MRLGAGPLCGACARALLSPPSIPGEGVAYDVRSFDPEAAAAAEATDRGAVVGGQAEDSSEERDPETEAGPSQLC